jgi:hypothetical protein
MRHARLACIAIFLAALADSRVVAATSIGVFFDSDATDCDQAVEAFTPFNVYVIGTLGADAAAGGITGARFSVDGLSDIVRSVTPNAAASVAIGDPTGGDGAIAFASCMSGLGSQNAVLLYTIVCLPLAPVSPRVVSVRRSQSPCDACHLFAPVVYICDANYTGLYVAGGEARINSGACTVSTRPVTWSTVKSMFKS